MDRFITLILFFVFTHIGYSQQIKVITNLTLEKAIEMALRENPQIKIAHMEKEKSAARITEAFSGLFPHRFFRLFTFRKILRQLADL